jgi:hypothetical protein
MRPILRLRRVTWLVPLAYLLVYRPWQRSWGATGTEVTDTLPGDEIVPRPQWEATRAVVVDARPDDVWPWLVQMGAHPRAGWYSYDWVDNAGIRSADEIRADLQCLRVGDRLPMTADASAAFVVESIDPARSLVMSNHAVGGAVSAAFVLRPHGPRGCRLIHRIRFRVPASGLPWAVAMDAGDFVMTRRMLLGIRQRAERLARRRRGGTEPTDDDPGTPLSYDLSVPIDLPPGRVHALLADVQDLEPFPRAAGVTMTKWPAGPTGVGTRWHERVRLAPGIWMRVESTVTAVSPPVSLDMDFWAGWCEGHLTYTIEPTPSGCRLHQRETLALRRRLPIPASWVDAGLRPRLLDRLADLRDVAQSHPV